MSQEFMNTLGPLALAISQQTGLDPRLVIAQSALETGWGKSAPGNNYFGIKSHGQEGGNTLATTEVVNGQPVRVNDSFRAYADPSESAADYAKFLQTNPRYANLLGAKTLDDQLSALGQSGYATDPNYAAKVGQIAKGIDINNMSYTPAKLPSTIGGQRTETALPQRNEDTSYVDSLLKGGPLALFGKGVKGYDWGTALMNAGAALASANSPAQAAALAGMARANQTNDWQMALDPQTGLVRRLNSRTGDYNSYVDQNAVKARDAYEKLKIGYRPPSDKAVSEFGNTRDYLDNTYSLAQDTQELIDTLNANPALGGWLSRAKALGSAGFDDVAKKFSPETYKSLTDAGLLSTEQEKDFFSKLERMKSKIVLAEQLKQKGVQTEGDAVRMGKAFFDTMSNLSGDQLKDALDSIRGGALKDHTRTFGTFKGYVDRYGSFNDIFNPANSQFDKYATQAQATNDELKKFEAAKEERRKQAGSRPAQPQNRPSLGSIFGN